MSHTKSPRHRRVLPSLAGLVLLGSLAGCGGGGNESGPPDDIYLSDSAIAVEGPDKLTCFTGEGPVVYIYGAQPPYKLSNSVPLAMTLSKTTVGDSGQGFTIFFNGTCLDNASVTIEDDMGRLTRLGVTNQEKQN